MILTPSCYGNQPDKEVNFNSPAVNRVLEVRVGSRMTGEVMNEVINQTHEGVRIITGKFYAYIGKDLVIR